MIFDFLFPQFFDLTVLIPRTKVYASFPVFNIVTINSFFFAIEGIIEGKVKNRFLDRSIVTENGFSRCFGV